MPAALGAPAAAHYPELVGPATGHLIETERKYEADARFVLPDLARLAGVAAVWPPERQRLAATYFDTAGLRLAAARITLRRRTGGSDAGWHVKRPAGPDSRREIHFPAGRSARTVPRAVAAEVAAWTGGEPLAPVARLLTTRIVLRLADPAGQVLAEVADDRVTASRAEAGPPGGPVRWAEPMRWREIEVELASGDSDLLDAAGTMLMGAGARRSASASKLAHVLSAGG